MRNRPILRILSAIILAACSSGGGTISPPPPPPSSAATVAAVSVAGGGTLAIGHTAQLVATPRDASGNALTGRSIAWISSASNIATISSSGLVTAVAAGSAVMTATSEGITGTASVTVTAAAPAAVASVTATASRTTLQSGDTALAGATIRDAAGNTLAGRTVTWSSTAPAIATVSSDGVVTAVAAGTAGIVATSEGIASAQLTFTVTAGLSASLLEQRVLAQQGFGMALASIVLQTQAASFLVLVYQEQPKDACSTADDGSSVKTTTDPVVPMTINFFFDATCSRSYLRETISQFASDTINHVYHGIGTGNYTSPTGAVVGSGAYDEESDQLNTDASGNVTGIVHGFATITAAGGGPTARIGIECNFGAGGHSLGICNAGTVQDYTGASKSIGSILTLALDLTASNTLTFTATSTIATGAAGSITLNEPTSTTMTLTGGTTYGTTTMTGVAGSFSLFPATPTGWSVVDAAHDATLTLAVTDNTTRNIAGTIKQTSTGVVLATFALDQSGSGTITYSDHTVSTVSSWMLNQ